MSDNRSSPRIRMPLLDRLLDADPDSPRDPPLSQSVAVEMLRFAVRRDLEALLNARRRRLPPSSSFPELSVSPIGYGVPDPTAGSFTEEERRSALSREIQATIMRFEPRLTAVKVQLHKNEGESIDRVLRLRIEALLRTDPVPEQIFFETEVRPTTLDVAVKER
ncbi:type VI secretion system baseplate subunit TssE [Roseomonas terrae]|jgi:type VI secretion system protein ImpF|uniref:Type VI secretion system baseplate subunit TssE n=1 Tax=Neoroseomonas terrae TaxID=424799 RepID=A0ABS5EH00_9PROT|nr:type VI secretion system baseplate subunit TssE [Neoroseomonas terrae]MBR0650304.1 type VI secretion system baseplate subunit TssE [Neoroseomonas terrae]